MTKSPHRKPASFRVEDVEVFVPPEPAAIPAEEPDAAGTAGPGAAQSQTGLALGQHLFRRARRSRQPCRLALALRLGAVAPRPRRLDRLGGGRAARPRALRAADDRLARNRRAAASRPPRQDPP